MPRETVNNCPAAENEKAMRPTILKNILNRYEITSRVGGGAFGEVYLASDKEDGKTVAVKTELLKVDAPQLPIEDSAYKVMKYQTGFAKVHFFGDYKGYRVLVMDMLGPNLDELLQFCGRKLSSKTVMMVAEQMIERLQALHDHDLIHRDIKPANFAVGRANKSNIIYLLDLGLCKQYRKTDTRDHVLFRTERPMTGTVRYVSLNAHRGFEQSRRDDMEALAYVLIYLAKAGKLPWLGLKIADKRTKFNMIMEIKQKVSTAELCKDLPDAFGRFLDYVRSLEFTQKPDYDYAKSLFYRQMQKDGLEFDYCFDWLPESLYKKSRRLKMMFT